MWNHPALLSGRRSRFSFECVIKEWVISPFRNSLKDVVLAMQAVY